MRIEATHSPNNCFFSSSSSPCFSQKWIRQLSLLRMWCVPQPQGKGGQEATNVVKTWSWLAGWLAVDGTFPFFLISSQSLSPNSFFFSFSALSTFPHSICVVLSPDQQTEQKRAPFLLTSVLSCFCFFLITKSNCNL